MVENLTKDLFSGAKWVSFQIIGMKIFSVLGQIILAWILVPDDFGKMAIVVSITSFAFLIQNFGLSDVLISRGKSFYALLPLSKTISLISGTVCLFVTIILGFIGGLLYEDKEITTLILLYSIAIPFNTFSIIPDAKLRIDLRFKELSYTQILSSFLTQLLTIIFALLLFGVYSFVLAPVIVSALRYLYLNHLSGISHVFKITIRHWKHLFYNISWGFIHALCQRVIQSADYLILGLFVTKTLVGIYYLAYSLSVQVIGFVVNTISPVLFPTILKIPKNQTGEIKIVLLNLLNYLSMIGMPFAMWQAVSAESLISLFLDDKWKETIPLVQILSLGIGFLVVGSLWELSLKLRSEFKKQAIFSIYSSLFFLVVVVPSTYYFKIYGTIIAVALYHFISVPILLNASFKFYKISLLEILGPIFKYFVLSILVFWSIYFFGKYLDCNLFLSLLSNGFVAPVAYLVILYLMDSKFKELIQKFKKNI